MIEPDPSVLVAPICSTCGATAQFVDAAVISHAYRELARVMRQAEAHIGEMPPAQCRRVVRLFRARLRREVGAP